MKVAALILVALFFLAALGWCLVTRRPCASIASGILFGWTLLGLAYRIEMKHHRRAQREIQREHL